MPEDLPSPYEKFVADARTTLVVPGASAELIVTGEVDSALGGLHP